MKIEEIKEKLKSVTSQLADLYGIDFLFVFGSAVDDQMKKTSDIDIAIAGSTNFKQELQLSSELSDILSPYKVDLVNVQKASPLLAYSSSSQAKLIYEKSHGLFANFRTIAFKRFVETKHLRDLEFNRTKQYLTSVSGL